MSAGARGVYGARQEVVVRQTEGLDFELSDLQDCSVHLRGSMGALRIRGLRRCLVYAGPVTGATFVEGGSRQDGSWRHHVVIMHA